jgi:Ca2+/Na+ antiporter
MIKNSMKFYLEINFFAQKSFGWKNANEGLKNVIITHLFFISEGFVMFLFSFLGKIGFYFVVAYLIIFMFYLRDRIEKKLDKNIDFIMLENEYGRISLNKKIFSSILSILMLCLSIVSMIYIFVLLIKIKNYF